MTDENTDTPTQFNDLRSFLDVLAATPGQGIAIVDRAVDTNLELSAVVKDMEGADDRAVLFRNVKGADGVPVVMNLYGAPARVALGLRLPVGASQADTIRRFDERMEHDREPVLHDGGPAQEVVLRGASVDLGRLPISIHAAQQGGRYITAGVLVVRDQDTTLHNGGIYRIMVIDRDKFTVSVDPGHDFGRVIERGAATGEEVRFALVLGGDPAFFLASQAKVPVSRDLYAVMGGLIDEPVDVIRCATSDILVPAHSEIVIEGRIVPGEQAPEGPFGEFSYYYGVDPQATVCRVEAITHRKNPIYADIHPIHADHRSLWLHPGREVSLLRKLRALVPDVTMVSLPLEGAGMVAIIAIKKRHNGDPRRALMLALSSDVFIKHAVIVDDDIDVHDPSRVIWALATRFQADRDVMVIPDVRGYIEDPSGYFRDPEQQHGKLTTKIGYDATIPLGTDFPVPADEIPADYQALSFLDYVANPSTNPDPVPAFSWRSTTPLH